MPAAAAASETTAIARPTERAGARRHASAHSGKAGSEQVCARLRPPRRHDRSGPEQARRRQPRGPSTNSRTSRGARSRHPLITLAGAALAFFLVFYGWRDLRYALSSGAPLELGAAAALFSNDKATADLANRYVRVAGVPDRESALELDTKGSWVFSQLFRVLGTGDRLFVHRMQNPLPAARAEADVFEGRLIRDRRAALRRGHPRLFRQARDGDALLRDRRAARGADRARAGRAAVDRRSGRRQVALAADEALAIEVVKPERCRSACRTARFPTEDAARAAIDAPRRRGDRDAGPGEDARRRRARARRACSPARRSRPRAGRSWCGSRARAGRRRWTSWATSIAPSRSATRARRSRRASPSWRRPTARWSFARPAGPNAALAAANVAAVHTIAPVVIPDGALPADRRRSPARSRGEHDHLAGADDLRRLQHRRPRPQPMIAANLRYPRGQEVPVRAARGRQGRPLRLRDHGLRPLPHRPRAQGGRVGRHRPPPARAAASSSASSATSPTSTTRSSSKANEEGAPADEVARKYTEEMHVDFRALGLAAARPRAARDRAHRRDDRHHPAGWRRRASPTPPAATSTTRCRGFAGYGQLSGQSTDDLQAGARIEVGRAEEEPARLRAVEGGQAGRAVVAESRGAAAGPAGTSSARRWRTATSARRFDIHGGGAT